jgi:hypothetical protein
MATSRSGKSRLLTVLGIALFGVGLTILLTQLDTAAGHFADRVGVTGVELNAGVPALLLATVRAAQAWAFDRPNVLSAVREMLLSCWPVMLLILGAALLRTAFNGLASFRRNGTTAAQGEL